MRDPVNEERGIPAASLKREQGLPVSSGEPPAIDFDDFWRIYCESFPEDERRSREDQLRIMEDHRYRIAPIEADGMPVGFITSWDLGEFIFGEHFAIDSRSRGRRIGEKSLRGFLHSLTRPFVVEVELPEDDISRRRISFYERLGMKLNDFDYTQPPYSEGQRPLPMKLMSYPDHLTAGQLEAARDMIYRVVYR